MQLLTQAVLAAEGSNHTLPPVATPAFIAPQP